MITLNGQTVPGFGVKVSASMHLAGEDLSGNSSSTAQAETGDKAKELNISLSIRYSDAKELTRLVGLAEAKGSTDERVRYNIVNRTAQALGIRQVQFQGDVSVREDDSLFMWSVTFKLVEYQSVPEKKEQRSPAMAKKINAPKPTGKTVEAPASVEQATQPSVSKAGAPAEDNQPVSSVERVLQRLDEALK